MNRRGRGLRRRYGRSRFRIGAGGLTRPETIHVTPGHIYSMGASSSPEAIRVLSVTGDRIQYRRESQYGDHGTRTIERWIGEDLIANGERTFKQRYGGVSTDRWHNMTPEERHDVLARIDPEIYGRRGR